MYVYVCMYVCIHVCMCMYVCMYVCIYKVLFTTVNKMLHRTPDKLYPSSESPATLANAFADFFTNEITKIRDELTPLSSISDSVYRCYSTK